MAARIAMSDASRESDDAGKSRESDDDGELRARLRDTRDTRSRSSAVVVFGPAPLAFSFSFS